MYYWIGNKLYHLSTSSPCNNVIHINMKMTASYIYNKCIHAEEGRGLSVNVWYHPEYRVWFHIWHPNLLAWCIHFCTFLNTIKLFSSVRLSEPNNKFSIEIGTAYPSGASEFTPGFYIFASQGLRSAPLHPWQIKSEFCNSRVSPSSGFMKFSPFGLHHYQPMRTVVLLSVRREKILIGQIL